MTDTTKMTLGIMGALLAGAAIGMLIAPQKGSDLRKSIRKKANDLANNVGDMINKKKDQWEEDADEDMSMEPRTI